ncbi:MAG: hypothetical protein DI551_01795 [Micavibrio aeruginosavorus]|uniref:SseB protein N-terminal domain-containing protein n=1 Tax=Micavibrio aeruginosavorus TaxID=349221 RepID=A0A2W5PU05_9BACT|nr:MAG: hypothetical protein DI551_01795 [Micavibrio aeruginosavorus]
MPLKTKLQEAVEDALTQKDIGLILPALRAAQFYAVCTYEEGVPVIWFMPSPADSSRFVMTVSEDKQWLEEAFAQNPLRPHMDFRPLDGSGILEIGFEENVEAYVLFGTDVFKISRNYFEHWAKNMPEESGSHA